MNTPEILAQLQKKLDVTIYGLGKRLGLRSTSHAWLLMKGGRLPSISTCKKIIKLGHEHGMVITLDMLRGED